MISLRIYLLVDEIEYPDLDEAMRPRIDPSVNTHSQPLVNRTNKPAIEVGRVEVEPTIEPSVYPVPLPRSNIPKTPSEVLPDPYPVNRIGSVPQINRDLKKSAMVKYLQDEEKLVEKHLAITVERLEKEREWETIRGQKEATANSEIAKQLQEREEQMLEMLRKMENENKLQVRLSFMLYRTFLKRLFNRFIRS